MIIKAFLSIIAVLSFLFVGQSVHESFSTVSITPNVKYDSCASGYTRSTPNLCLHLGSTASQETFNITVTGRTTSTLTTVPASASVVILQVQNDIRTSGVVNQKFLSTNFYNDGTCTVPVYSVASGVWEFVITTNGFNGLVTDSTVPIKIFSGTIRTNTTFSNTGTSTSVVLRVKGYYD